MYICVYIYILYIYTFDEAWHAYPGLQPASFSLALNFILEHLSGQETSEEMTLNAVNSSRNWRTIEKPLLEALEFQQFHGKTRNI